MFGEAPRGGTARFCTYDPQSVKFNDFVEVLDKISPVFADVWMEIIRERSVLTVQLRVNRKDTSSGLLY